MRASLPLTLTAARRWGEAALAAALGLGLLITAWLAWSAPDLLPFLPLALLVAVGGVVLFRHPRLNFVVWLMGFPLLLSSEAGLQLQEVLYGPYFFGYLAHWYGRRLLLYRSRMIRGIEDRAVALWLTLGLAGGIALGLVFGAPPAGLVGEVIAFLMLSLYFPIKEFCVRERHGPLIIFLLIVWMGVFVTLENAFVAQQRFAAATQVWEVADVRTAGRELFLMFSVLLVVAALTGVRSRRVTLGLLVVLAIVFTGLILTKSRTFWVAVVFGAFILTVLLPESRRRRLLLLTGGGLLVLGVLAVIFVGPYLALLYVGIQNRLLSLGAASTDVSLLNRFVESDAVREKIWRNPVLGYGLGTQYSYFRLIEHATMTYSYIHNGYLAVWYKLGLWGVLLVGTTWVRAAWCAFRAGRDAARPPLERVLGLGAAASLAAMVFPVYTNNVFFQDDKLAAFILVAALGCGLYQRSRLQHPEAGRRLTGEG